MRLNEQGRNPVLKHTAKKHRFAALRKIICISPAKRCFAASSLVSRAIYGVVLCLVLTSSVHAHPMGNFAICHYARLQADPNDVRVRYVIDMAEIPTLTEKETLEKDTLGHGQDGAITPAEQATYLAARAAQLASGVTLTVNGAPAALALTGSTLRLSPGAGGLETLKVTLDWLAASPSGTRTITWEDRNYPSRTGWKEVVAVAGNGVALQDSSVSGLDRSRGLSIYPRDIIPPQDTDAHFTAVPAALVPGAASAASLGSAGPLPATRDATPRDLFTETIARHALTPGIMLLGLLIAFVFGSFHALSPGHGKTMVAAYLVGSRGTSRHAVVLGLIVTITHTLGVFALGIITLFASRYIVPEKLYPFLSAVSGLAVFGVGLWLLVSRLRGISTGHDHSHTHDHSHEHIPDDHAHGPDEIHLHETDHTHTHDDGHAHSHGFGSHTHAVPDGPITMRSLLALGISGGIVPCPSALVVLLSAVALHRIVYGMALITAFSIGLATVLIVIGLMVVSTRHWFERFPMGEGLLRRLPVVSAAAITLIGLMLIVRAVTQGV
jgi:nickel/cobalt exporter